MRKKELIESPSDVRPHVVILGAGASRAAFPNGDSLGRRLPLMNNELVDDAGLKPIFDDFGENLYDGNDFESTYSKLASNPRYKVKLAEIENRIRSYFSSLQINSETTLYDYLLLSLRKKDAIFTFNWDPLLFDAYKRNAHISPLPGIYFLHGNVRIGMCPIHIGKWGERQLSCPVCAKPFSDIPLLYPVENKNYSNHPYIRGNWEEAKCLFREAHMLTIFGYGAPVSDADAVELLRQAWMERSSREFEYIEIINVENYSKLYESWKLFTPTHHLKIIQHLKDSWITMYPRRSVEAFQKFSYSGEPCENFPLAETNSLPRLQKAIMDIAEWEFYNEKDEN